MSSTSPVAAVLVTGASSQLGVFVLPRLRAAGFTVLAISRQAPAQALQRAPGLYWLRPEQALSGAAVTGLVDMGCVRHLVSCGPLGLAAQLVERYESLRRVVAFSSSSVVAKAASGDAAEAAQVAELAAGEAALRAGCATRGAALLLLRPTLIYGCGLDRNVSRLLRLAHRWGLVPLAGKAGGLRQPVHADDLAAVAIAALLAAEPVRLVSPACGGSTLTYRQMTARLFAVCARQPRLPGLPEGLLVSLVKLALRLPAARGLNAEMVKRQNRNLVFDDSRLREALPYRPRPFEPTATDFEIPASARALQLPARSSSGAGT